MTPVLSSGMQTWDMGKKFLLHICVIIIMSFAYYIIGLENFLGTQKRNNKEREAKGLKPINEYHDFHEAIYISIYTHSTVAYGDIVPKTIGAEWLLLSRC